MKKSTLVLAALAALAAAPAHAQQQPRSEQIGSFRYARRVDPITDADVSYISVDQETAGPLAAVLQWRCMKDGGYGIWVGSESLEMADSADVTWRFDQTTPATARWRVVSGRLVAMTDGWEAFTASAKTSRRLAVRVALPSGRELTWIFPLTGATAALGRLPCVAEQGDGAAANQ